MKTKQLIYECQTHRLLTEQWNLLTEDQRSDIILFEREIGPLYKQLHEALGAELTADQVDALFKKAEQVTSGDKTLAGKALGAVGAAAKLPFEVTAKINKKMDDLFKEKIKTMKPVQNFDAAFNKLKENIVAKTGGKDGGVMKSVEAYRNFAKKHPIAQSLIIAALTTLAGFIGGPLGGAIANFGLRSIDRLLKGEDISDVLYKGAKSAVTGALIGLGVRKLTEMIGNAYAEFSNPVKLTKEVTLVQGNVSISTDDPAILKALKDAGLEGSANDSTAFDIFTTDAAAANAFKAKIDALNKFISEHDSSDPETLKHIIGQANELSTTADTIGKSMHKVWEGSHDYLLDPSKNAVLQQMGINHKVSYDDYNKIFKDFTEKFNIKIAGGTSARVGEIGYLSNQAYIQAGMSVDQAANVGDLTFIPTKEFAKTVASVAKQVDVSRVSAAVENTLTTKGDNLAAIQAISSMIQHTGQNAVEAANAIINSAKISTFFGGLGNALQAAAQGATAGSDTAQDNKKDAENDKIPDFTNESLMLSEIYKKLQKEAYDPKTGNYNTLPDETTSFTGLGDKIKGAAKGAWDKTKSAASGAASAVGTAAKNITQKITYDKLMKAWTDAGKPLQTAKVLDVMKKAGMSDEQIDVVQSDKPATTEEPKPSREEKVKKFAEYIKRKKLVDAVKAYLNTTAEPTAEKKPEEKTPEKSRGSDFLNPISETRKYRRWK
jgi:hypothetical protein